MWSVTISAACDKALKVTQSIELSISPSVTETQTAIFSSSVRPDSQLRLAVEVSQRDVRDVICEKHVLIVKCQSLHVVTGSLAGCDESGRLFCYVMISRGLGRTLLWSNGTAVLLETSRPVLVLSSVSCVDIQ